VRVSVRRTAFVVVIVCLLAGLLTGVRTWHARAAADAIGRARCHDFAAAHAARAAAVSGTGRRVVVIGDSWSAGLGLADPDRSWPARLPGRVYVDGFSGSGFSAYASPCGPVAYFQRAHRAVQGGADLVVVEGGLNDVDQSSAAITDGFHRLMAALRGRDVVVVGPPMAPSRAAGVPRVDRLLAALSKDAAVPYLSTVDLRLGYQPDRLHPTQAGADAFGDAVATFVAGRPA
jgi:acyl-CoA thioesterase-1